MIILYFIIAAICLFILIPIKFSLSVNKSNGFFYFVSLYFMLGLIGFRLKGTGIKNQLVIFLIGAPVFKYCIKSSDKTNDRKIEGKKKKPKKKKIKTKKKSSFGVVKMLKLAKKYIVPLVAFIKRSFTFFSWDRLHINGEYGIMDNYVNGLTYGVFCAARSFLPEKVRINLFPVFNRNHFEGTVKLRMSFRIYRVILSSLIFGGSILRLKLRRN